MSSLRRWFQSCKRPFPWRTSPTPYRVWVSEVMLQQTRAEVVIPYFERWMEQYPTVEALAKADLDDVIKAWEGLGYYSRARNLHAGAQLVVERFGGELPSNEEELSQIKGLGPYTIGAILSFAFHKKAAAVDGNVARVVSRLYTIDSPLGKGKTQKILKERTESFLPDERPWEIMEGLIELGARICTPVPKCSECPLQGSCKAYALQCQQDYPVKPPRQKTIPLHRQVAVVECDEQVLVRRNKEGKVMADLYEFPYCEAGESFAFDFDLEHKSDLPEVKHTFTRYRVRLSPSRYSAEQLHVVSGHQWVQRNELERLPFSSGHRRVLARIMNDEL